MIRIISIIPVLLFFLFSCGTGVNEIEQDLDEEQVNYEEALDVNMIYSDSAIIRVEVSGPRMLRYLDRDNPRQEFPDGIKVVFYNASNRVSSTMTADLSTRYDKTNEIHVRNNVVWESFGGEQLETEELIWQERKEKVYSNRFVQIKKPDEVIYGYGFEANQEFTEWTINAVEGEFLRSMIDDE